MTTPTQPATGTIPEPIVRTGRDLFLDTVKAVAVIRVVLWHTWSWWWLSWIPAMPVMFFASGALLEDSLERRGWWPTVRQRFRRLMIPFWAYSLASVVVMVALGWRPGPGDLVGWVVPLVDPVGDPTLPGLWIPLWYVRAYLWFVLGSQVLSRLVSRFGASVVIAPLGATLAAWWWTRSGHTVAVELGDALAYSAFVMAGMRYRTHGAPDRRSAALVGFASAAVACWWFAGFGPADGVVNRSYPLTVAVGAAGIAIALVFREQLAGLRGRAGRIVEVIGRRALTIYLWQGFGLVAAQRLVDARMEPGPVRAAASLAVVVTVIVAAVVLVGPLEDRAARRPHTARVQSPPALVGIAVLVIALVLPVPDQAVEAPLSGKAVVARAERIRRSLEARPGPVSDETATGATASDRSASDGNAPGDSTARASLPVPQRLAIAIDDWVDRHDGLPERLGLGRIDGAVVDSSGEPYHLSWVDGAPAEVGPGAGERADPPTAWWSMTKAATAVWFLRAVEEGKVHLDDHLGRWVPEAPNAERITLEQLARHTSGIPGELDGDFLTTAPDVAMEKYRRNSSLAFDPGQGFDYSRTGYFLLALALERSTGVTWRSAMEDLARAAGVTLGFDEDTTPFDRVTDPDAHGYHGGLWASGGITSSLGDGARFFHWAFTEGLDPGSLDQMSDFSADPERWFYGIGLMPLCPCETHGEHLSSKRYGLDAATGFMVHDEASGATVMVAPDMWFDDDGPVEEFYDLQAALLDAASG